MSTLEDANILCWNIHVPPIKPIGYGGTIECTINHIKFLPRVGHMVGP